jgi:hypothetical protein
METIKLKDLPIGRIGRYTGMKDYPNYLYVARFSELGGYLKIWPNTDSTTKKASAEVVSDTDLKKSSTLREMEVELLPETTTVTFQFNGINGWRTMNN